MSLSIGIVGLPNVGKSTLFNALTQKSVPAENYPFCTIDQSVGIVAVPDRRLSQLADFSKTQKTIPAVIEFVDIAGLVEGASKGEGLGNKFLANIREVDAILHMVRIFEIQDDTGSEQTHVYGSIDPLRDIKVINMELILADMESVQNRISKLARDVKRGDKIALAEDALCQKILGALENEQLANTVELSDSELSIVKGLHLLTMKPVMYGLNKKTGGKNLDITNPQKFAEITNEIESEGSQFVVIDAKTEHDLSEFEGEDKQIMKEVNKEVIEETLTENITNNIESLEDILVIENRIAKLKKKIISKNIYLDSLDNENIFNEGVLRVQADVFINEQKYKQAFLVLQEILAYHQEQIIVQETESDLGIDIEEESTSSIRQVPEIKKPTAQ